MAGLAMSSRMKVSSTSKAFRKPPAAGSPLRSRRATGMKMAATRAVANSSRIMNFVSRSVIVCPKMSQDQWGRGTRSSGIRPNSFTPFSEGNNSQVSVSSITCLRAVGGSSVGPAVPDLSPDS